MKKYILVRILFLSLTKKLIFSLDLFYENIKAKYSYITNKMIIFHDLMEEN